MSKDIIPFVDTQTCIGKIFSAPDSWPEGAPDLYVVRDLYGRIRIVLSEDSKDTVKKSKEYSSCLKGITNSLLKDLGPRAYPSKDSVLYAPSYLLAEPGHAIHEIDPHTNVFFVERLVTGHSWWTVKKSTSCVGQAKRYVLYSVKGGVGCSTTAAILAWHLAHCSEPVERVMVVDLGLESPGLPSGMLAADEQPKFGIVDWFVEDLVGQGDRVIEQMTATPSWSKNFPSEVCVIPAHGREPGEFLAKLGRTYLHTVNKRSGKGVAWASRLEQLLLQLEKMHKPTIVLLENCSGLNDIAASVVTELNASRIFLFATDSESTWENYQILFRHWRDIGLAANIRKRLSLVSALTPKASKRPYMTRFRGRAWNLFRDSLYSKVDLSESSIDNFTSIPIIWERCLVSGTSLQGLKKNYVLIKSAYNEFLGQFDKLRNGGGKEDSQCNNSISAKDARQALIELPDGVSHGEQPPLEHIYIPQSHIKAIHPNSLLVTGMRGAGKTFWWAALQDENTRQLLSQHSELSILREKTEVRVGFGVKGTPDEYPNKNKLKRMIGEGIEPQTIWKTVLAWHLAPSDHPLRKQNSWLTRTKYVIKNTGNIERLFKKCDADFEQKKSNFLLLFDSLDLCADDRKTIYLIIRGLLQVALLVLSYRRIRMKIFLRPDQLGESEIANFPNASRIFELKNELAWPHYQLYGLLWHHLGHSEKSGRSFQKFLSGSEWDPSSIDGTKLVCVPKNLIFKRDIQQKKFHAFTGEWMGAGPTQGFPYNWIPNHLADAKGEVTPRSFFKALRTAAEDTGNRYYDHENALHYDSIKTGVQAASKTRRYELQKDYPEVDMALKPLIRTVVPCDFDEIKKCWEKNQILDQITRNIEQDDIMLLRFPIHEGLEGMRQYIESLGIFQHMNYGRVNIPDIFRIAYGLERRRGVKPVRWRKA